MQLSDSMRKERKEGRMTESECFLAKGEMKMTEECPCLQRRVKEEKGGGGLLMTRLFLEKSNHSNGRILLL